MKIKVYSKPGCGICESAKKKIKLMGFDYEEHNLEYHINHHEGWKESGATDLMSHCAFEGDPNHQLPTIEIIENGKSQYFDYPSAMRYLKKVKKHG